MSEVVEVTLPNTPFTRETLERDMRKFGTDIGKGNNARPAMFLRAVEAATKINVGPDDAEDLYTITQKAIASSRGLEYSAEASQKVQVSKLRVALKLGNLPKIDPMQVMYDAGDLIAEFERLGKESPLKGSAYDNLVAVGRKQLDQPDVQLSKDELRQFMSQVPEEVTSLDRVIQAYKSSKTLADKLRDAGIEADYVDTATNALADQIRSMDGELPPMSKAEKQQQAALQTLKAAGYTLIKQDSAAA